MTIRTILLGAAVALSGALVASASNAAVIYSNFGPGQSYAGGSGWTLDGPDTDEPVFQGMSFTAAASGNVSQIDIAIHTLNGGANSGAVSLWTSNFGAELGSWAFSGAPNCCGGTGAIEVTGISGAHLDAGTTYQLVANVDSSFDGFWNWNTTGATGNVSEDNFVVIDNFTTGAFDVLSGGVPEPASWALMLVGFGGAGAALRRRRRAARAVTA
jgi:hypothetical protein